MALNNQWKAAVLSAAKATNKVDEAKRALGTTKDSGAVPENEKRIRGMATAKEASRNNLVKSGFASAGAAIAQAARAGRNNLRRR